MNRSERRKSGVKEKPKTYTMTDAQLEKIQSDALKEAREGAFLKALSIPVLVLSDKFGFDEDKLSKFVSSCMTWLRCVYDGEATMEEIVAECEKLANIKFTKSRTGR